jgi:hypothetical protein
MDFEKELERVAQESRDEGYGVITRPTTEAVLRRLAPARGGDGLARSDATVLLRELYANGRLSHPEFVGLDEMRLLHLAIVHGFGPPPVDAGMVAALVGSVKRLLTESEASGSLAG